MKRVFLICPVRGHDSTETSDLVRQLETNGYAVHWPPRDTDQEDSTGLRICTDNYKAIRDADIVFLVWDGKSQGCLFDLGVAFALHKSLICLQLPVLSEGKSFQNMAKEWQEHGLAD